MVPWDGMVVLLGNKNPDFIIFPENLHKLTDLQAQHGSAIRWHDRAILSSPEIFVCLFWLLINLVSILQMDHPYLRFSNNAREGYCIPKVERLWDRRHLIEPMRRLQKVDLDLLGQAERFDDLITPPWSRLFEIAEPQYIELVIEFFASFRCTFPCPDVYDKNVGVKFRLGRKWHHQSISRFAEVLGLYTGDEIESELFHGSLQDWAPDADKAAFWNQITVPGRLWEPRKAKATWILDPLHRVIERAIFHVIGGRGDSTGNITTRDLFHLYCIVSGYHCNVAVSVAESIFRGVGSTTTSRICGGAFATKLAKYYRVSLDNLTEACDYGLLDLQQMKSMHLIRKVNGVPKLVDRLGRIWDPLAINDETDDDDEGGDGGDHDVHMHDIPVQGQEGAAGGAGPQLQIGQGFESPNWENVYGGFGGGGYEHGPYEPSGIDLWRRMDGLEIGQQEMRRDVDLIRAEQHRQGNFLEDIYEQSRRSMDWLFGSQQHIANSINHPYTQPPPQFRRRSRFDPRSDAGPSGSGERS